MRGGLLRPWRGNKRPTYTLIFANRQLDKFCPASWFVRLKIYSLLESFEIYSGLSYYRHTNTRKGTYSMNIVKQFSQIHNDWREWQREGHSLRRAAHILRQEAQRDWDDRKRNRDAINKDTYNFPPALEGVIALLNGLTIENFVKALWVKTNNSVLAKKGKGVGKLKSELDKHEMEQLINDVNFTLSDEEKMSTTSTRKVCDLGRKISDT